MTCTRCNDVREVWNAEDKTYDPCSCLAEQRERVADAPPIDERCFGPLHDDALRIYAAMITGAVSRADTRLEEVTGEFRVALMCKAIEDAWGLRRLMVQYQDSKKKEPPK